LTLDEFKASVSSPTPPRDLEPALTALWHDARGEWTAAHEIAQDVGGPTGAWVHAYLHRKEGDLTNAAYWYRVAGQVVASGPLELEWTTIAETLLRRTDETGRHTEST
jgi:hypothetical protein